MKFVRIIEADWGGRASTVSGELELYGYKFEWVRVKSGAHLKRECEVGIASAKNWTLVVFTEGLINQFGKGIREKVLEEAGRLRVLWIDVPTPRGSKFPKERKVDDEGPAGEAALMALGESLDRKRNVLAELEAAAGERFLVTLSCGVFELYQRDVDREFHLSIAEVAKHFDGGDLKKWIAGIIRDADRPRK